MICHWDIFLWGNLMSVLFGEQSAFYLQIRQITKKYKTTKWFLMIQKWEMFNKSPQWKEILRNSFRHLSVLLIFCFSLFPSDLPLRWHSFSSSSLVCLRSPWRNLKPVNSFELQNGLLPHSLHIYYTVTTHSVHS